MKNLEQLEAPPAACCAPLVGASLTDEEALTTAEMLKALADPTRVRIVNLLATSDSSVCVCELNEHFDLSQPTISHHLKKLVAAGILAREQRGTWAYFSVDHDVLNTLADAFRTREGASA